MNQSQPPFETFQHMLNTTVRDLLRRLTPNRRLDLHGVELPEVGNVVIVTAYGPEADWLAQVIKEKGGENLRGYEGTVPHA